jgi:hypothetical protein
VVASLREVHPLAKVSSSSRAWSARRPLALRICRK